ncbi:MAG: hypothetical protein AAB654_05800 [Acidobacteriota bacterium]
MTGPDPAPAPELRELLDCFPSLGRLTDIELAYLLHVFGQMCSEGRKHGLNGVDDFGSRWLALCMGLLHDAGYGDINELKSALAVEAIRPPKSKPGIN